ncbi:MAG: hypothetical protein U0L42_05265 [Methanobrevibacter sp.]|uniref:tetratricopeptide repeat protein n=1 Tax=Methanobrevibacter sp. TaxID=66852 RepID=UPI002E7A8F81|nr:tetratricopeptide repeat protein [Methanobrevibacter sp.]MEE0935064.1 hypothetical protein [Methanobrevibacter sp.]
MTLLDIPESRISSKEDGRISYDFNLTVFINENQLKFAVGDLATSWIGPDDNFIKRINFSNLNPYSLQAHILKEIEIKNTLDEAKHLLGNDKYGKAISLLDDVLYYDPEYGEALFFKSKAIFGQGHFVKSLRHYKRAVRCDGSLKDVEYHKLLLKKSSEERDSFPKIKQNIYAGDEYFAKGDFKNALESYDRALENPTRFKTKILSKLLNKKATALVKLQMTEKAVEVFTQSVSVKPNDYAYFYLGIYSDTQYLKKALDISKRQLLMKASKLHEAGENDLALDCVDEFLANHFKVDDDYRRALDLKLEVLGKLNLDASEIESLIEKL